MFHDDNENEYSSYSDDDDSDVHEAIGDMLNLFNLDIPPPAQNKASSTMKRLSKRVSNIFSSANKNEQKEKDNGTHMQNIESASENDQEKNNKNDKLALSDIFGVTAPS
eukprot:443805_1